MNMFVQYNRYANDDIMFMLLWDRRSAVVSYCVLFDSCRILIEESWKGKKQDQEGEWTRKDVTLEYFWDDRGSERENKQL